MKFVFLLFLLIACLAAAASISCSKNPSYAEAGGPGKDFSQPVKENASGSTEDVLTALAVENFLADLTLNISGSRLEITSLIPYGLDPHEYEPVPSDFAKVSGSRILVMNGNGLEGWLEQSIRNSRSSYIIEASKGLEDMAGIQDENSNENLQDAGVGSRHGVNPHFWLDPIYTIEYVKNICSGLIKADPDGSYTYIKNANSYILQLKELDMWIKNRAGILPENKKLLVTNHESLGYFAGRYGFKIIGTIIPGFSTDGSITAKEFAGLVNAVKLSGAKVIFLETGSNPDIAEQLAAETGIKVVYNLYTHSLSTPGGEASTYINMMKFNVNTIINNLQ